MVRGAAFGAASDLRVATVDEHLAPRHVAAVFAREEHGDGCGFSRVAMRPSGICVANEAKIASRCAVSIARITFGVPPGGLAFWVRFKGVDFDRLLA